MSESEFNKERPKKNFLYERNIDGVISHAQCKSSKNDVKTTIYIPIEQEIALKDLEDEYRKSRICTIKYAVQLGFSIFEHENKENISQIDNLRKKLRHSKNSQIPYHLFTLKRSVGKAADPIKRAIIQDGNIAAAIKNSSDNLNISLTSFIQTLLNYAISTTKNNSLKDIRNNAREEKIHFQKIIDEALDILIRLIAGEKEDEIEFEDIPNEEDEEEKWRY